MAGRRRKEAIGAEQLATDGEENSQAVGRCQMGKAVVADGGSGEEMRVGAVME